MPTDSLKMFLRLKHCKVNQDINLYNAKDTNNPTKVSKRGQNMQM
jgi:hypothetical protein